MANFLQRTPVASDKFKNPRLNALLSSMSHLAPDTRVTPKKILTYDKNGKTIIRIKKL